MSGISKRVGLEQRANVETVVLPVKVTLKCNTTDASIRGLSDLGGDVLIFTEEDGQTPPSDASFPTLDDDAAPGIIGVYAYVQDARELVSATIDAGSIKNGGSLAMSAGVVTREGDVSASPGVTATKNISLSVSCTGLDMDSEVADTTFILNLTYIRDMRV